MTNQTQRIRALNDDLRQHLIGGGAVIDGRISKAHQLPVSLGNR